MDLRTSCAQVFMYRAYVAWAQWRAQDVVSEGATFPFPPNTQNRE